MDKQIASRFRTDLFVLHAPLSLAQESTKSDGARGRLDGSTRLAPGLLDPGEVVAMGFHQLEHCGVVGLPPRATR